MNAFEQIMDTLDVKEAMRFYGVEIIRNMAKCPFHNDRHPSMSFKNNRYRCWVCGESGSIVDFATKHYGISTGEAVKKINADFNLGLDMGKPNPAQVKKRNNSRKLVEAFEAWESKAYSVYTDYFRHLRWVIDNVSPDWFGNSEKLDYYVKCLHQVDRIEHIVDTFIYGDFNEKLEIFTACRREVERLEHERKGSGIE